MARRVAYYRSVPNFSVIFGANYLDDYDLNDGNYVTRSGGIVSRIDSKTGTGAYFEQTTLADRPTWELNQINGKNVLRFDGVSDYMVHPSSTAYYNFIHDGSGS